MNLFRSLRGEKCGIKVGKRSRTRIRPGVERVENRCLAAVGSFVYFNDQSANVAEFSGQNSTKPAFEIKDFSFGIENPTTIGSGTGGAGGGKVKFNEFTITKTPDSASAAFFANCVAGAHYKSVVIEVPNAGGGSKSAGKPYLNYKLNTVFVSKIDWSGPGDEGPEESITFVYGKLRVKYEKQQTIRPVGLTLAPAPAPVAAPTPTPPPIGSGQPVSASVVTTYPPATAPTGNLI